MIRVRAIFEKKGRAKYISHLDLNRCMLRTFRRSGLPIWYTEGFNPHPYYSFALALSLGYESGCEILDFNLNEDIPFDVIRDKLNNVMPEGMRVVSVAEQKMKITRIAKAEYSFSIFSENTSELLKDINELLESDQILVDKKTKKGIKTVDIKPETEVCKCEAMEKSVDMTMRLPAGTQTNYNPNLFFDALEKHGCVPFTAEKICRTGIFCENNEIFS